MNALVSKNSATAGGNPSAVQDDLRGEVGDETKNAEVNYKAEEQDEPSDAEELQQVGTFSIVETKTEDAGSQAHDGHMSSDAFSRYSNTNVRMMMLLGLSDGTDDEENEDNEVWKDIIGYQDLRRARGAGQDVRKTRISTELHPSAFYSLMFADLQ